MIKNARLTKRKRTTRGEGKKDRMEWALVSKKNPKKILRWFGPRKPSKKEVAKEERRVHSFASNNSFKQKRTGTKMIKELISLANSLDERGLLKEADALDEIIKEANVAKDIADKVQSVWNWIKPYSGASQCSRRTAMAMISLTPDERARFPGCTARDYEFSDDADKIDILKALNELKLEGTRYSVDPVLSSYMSKLVTKGMLTGEMISGDKKFFEAFLSNSLAGGLSGHVRDLIAFGVNAGMKQVNKHINRTDKTIYDAKKHYTTPHRGVSPTQMGG